MNLCALLFCLSLGSSPAAPQPERWIGEDKWKHFFASFVATSLSASALRAAGASADASLAGGAAVGGGLGIWKEVRDERREDGTVSFSDLAWDFVGVGAATVMVAQTR